MIIRQRTQRAMAEVGLASALLSGCASDADLPSASGTEVHGANRPLTLQPAYLQGTSRGVTFTPIITTGESVNNKPDGVTPYRMVGIPDGLGAFDNGDGTFTLLANHELPNTVAIVRD